jgi:hypothetical protein
MDMKWFWNKRVFVSAVIIASLFIVARFVYQDTGGLFTYYNFRRLYYDIFMLYPLFFMAPLEMFLEGVFGYVMPDVAFYSLIFVIFFVTAYCVMLGYSKMSTNKSRRWYKIVGLLLGIGFVILNRFY